jgi:hypothetical protein
MSLNKLVILSFLFIFSSCGFYKMNGVSIPPDVESVSIQYIENKALIINPLLSQTVSEKLKNKFISETRLLLTAQNGDFALQGEITDYTVEPVSIQNNTTSTLNRLKITIRIKMDCLKHPKLSFDQSFTQFQDFDANKSFTSVETNLVSTITDMLVQEIFNKTAINW